MNTQEKIEVMQAFLKGEEIEHCGLISNDWVPLIAEPVWDWRNNNYRIKKEPRRFYIVEFPHAICKYTDKDAALRLIDYYKMGTLIEVLEVL